MHQVAARSGLGGAQRAPNPSHHLATHAVVVRLTGSGETGHLPVLVQKAVRERVPVEMVDVKGDLPKVLLAFPSFAPKSSSPGASPRSATRASSPESPTPTPPNTNRLGHRPA